MAANKNSKLVAVQHKKANEEARNSRLHAQCTSPGSAFSANRMRCRGRCCRPCSARRASWRAARSTQSRTCCGKGGERVDSSAARAKPERRGVAREDDELHLARAQGLDGRTVAKSELRKNGLSGGRAKANDRTLPDLITSESFWLMFSPALVFFGGMAFAENRSEGRRAENRGKIRKCGSGSCRALNPLSAGLAAPGGHAGRMEAAVHAEPRAPACSSSGLDGNSSCRAARMRHN